jgi:hypothetical protein
MKKTYIEPKNTVVRLKLETLIASSPVPGTGTGNASSSGGPGGDSGDGFSREVINSQDVWEEW